MKIPISVTCKEHTEHQTCFNCASLPEDNLVSVEMRGKTKSLSVYSDSKLNLLPTSPYPTGFFIIHGEVLDEHLPGDKDESKWGEAIEVETAIQTSRDLSAGLPQVRSFITALRTIDVPIGVNNSCGFHVHAGYLQGMTLLSAKKITTLLMLLESGLLRPIVFQISIPKLLHKSSGR